MTKWSQDSVTKWYLPDKHLYKLSEVHDINSSTLPDKTMNIVTNKQNKQTKIANEHTAITTLAIARM